MWSTAGLTCKSTVDAAYLWSAVCSAALQCVVKYSEEKDVVLAEYKGHQLGLKV